MTRESLPDHCDYLTIPQDLGRREWEDIAYMAQVFELNFGKHPAFTNDEDTRRRLALAARIREAVE